jgi:hypothetical protein
MTCSKLAAQVSIAILLSVSPAAFAYDLYKIDSDHTSVVFSVAHKHAYSPRSPGLLPARNQRPCRCRWPTALLPPTSL